MKQLTSRFGAILDQPPTGFADVPPDLWGFGGAHGGLATALAVAHMRDAVGPGPGLRSVHAHLLRPLRERHPVTTTVLRRGRTTTIASARVGDTEAALTATATFSARPDRAAPSAPVPDVVGPDDAEPISFPVELVPFAQHTEIRALGNTRPFAGGDRPELTAWIRFVDDPTPPGELRIVTLLDALAPSHAAVLSAPVPIPTVEYAVHLSGATAAGPWIVVHARTVATAADGFLTEHLDAWDEAGTHLGSATQLRVVVG